MKHFSFFFFLLTLLPLTLSPSVKADKRSPQLEQRQQSLLGLPVYLRIFKEESLIELYVIKDNQYQLVDSYPICKYSGGLGPKTMESDFKSPEGFYSTSLNDLNPNSRYHLSFNIGYPNAFDKSNNYTGKYLMVHGDCRSQGCYAMGNEGIEKIYRFIEEALNNRQPQIDIHIFPFKMTESNMNRHSNSKYYPFWKQLKPAYDYFEEYQLAPIIYVSNKQYMVLPRQMNHRVTG